MTTSEIIEPFENIHKKNVSYFTWVFLFSPTGSFDERLPVLNFRLKPAKVLVKPREAPIAGSTFASSPTRISVKAVWELFFVTMILLVHCSPVNRIDFLSHEVFQVLIRSWLEAEQRNCNWFLWTGVLIALPELPTTSNLKGNSAQFK